MFVSGFLLGAVLFLAGCGYTQQSKFQMSFLPPAPLAPSEDASITDPPAVASAPNPYLEKVPALLLTTPRPPRHQLLGDAKVQGADQALARGTQAYRRNDTETARREFDTAIDLMLDACDSHADDRDDFENHLDEMVEQIHRMDLSGLGASAEVDPGRFEKAPLEDILQMTFPVDPKLKDRVREQVAATTSQLPLSVNDTVLGYINYFSNRGHKTIIAATERSGRYRPMIQRILDEEGVPQELIHLAQAESGFIPRALSRKAAVGMWQFVAFRGQQYGLIQTRFADDRMDPEKATRAAARHLRDLYSEFGDWYLAIAAYNCGPGVVERAVERTGYADFWHLRSLGVLPAETTNYVPIILAMTIMEKNAAEYGLESVQFDPPLQYDTIQTTAPTSMTLVADIIDSPQAELVALNPAVLKATAPANYPLHVPKGTGNQLMATLETIPAEHRDSWRMHRVAPGETLAAIGKRYGTSPSAITAANKLASAEATEGDRLLIPAAARLDAPVRRAPAKTPARHSASAHTTAKGRTASASPGRRKPSATLASAR
jgi:membrane-bound lytic murein transglycosylase D